MSALVLTMAIGMRKGRGEPGTTVIRAIVSVWICAGISMRFLFPAMSLAGTPPNQLVLESRRRAQHGVAHA